MPRGRDALSCITSEATIEEVFHEHNALSGTISKVPVEEGEAIPYIASKATGGEEDLQGT